MWHVAIFSSQAPTPSSLVGRPERPSYDVGNCIEDDIGYTMGTIHVS
ncbi:hypothetical protein TUN199_04994 [Pyrenophora tritici-repentis]|uniref:Uncharacterized protein n=1 Tax=Pyrenophora tritici-repentis TaxID=45151 RepID=A0A5M9L394_9PLEO|nr:hypothetical protein PtrV1_06708 [Pyrenophora tritici-repentis]KAF7571452.1 hypothetical protein PtrM4_089520 [Pyrenophora tritici-repentis]KAI0573512.1 hypothetical protein Alg130_10064 [Pyrenophora tritici-repentis]KAI0578673.1 hypothetical protein Alg215_06189 [Pyrenophora tritici-repentis]KAI0605732.1 hypothetical protein TUN205_10020 [Pyrenophora tritici-repentis]